MPFCVEAPVIKDWPDCCVWDICFECGLTMPSDKSMAKDFTWAGYFVIFILFLVGCWNTASLYRVYKDNDNYVSIMRIGNTLYAFGTAIFGFCRVHFQLGKPLLIFAAIHNQCEWVFVAFAFYQNRKIREYAIFGSICWITLVIGLMMVILTEFPYFALVEQVTGISLDFMLPFIWLILWLQNRDSSDSKTKKGKSKRKATSKTAESSTIEPAIYSIGNIYFIAFIAHTVHILGTILPLVVVNFIRDQNETLSRVIEFLIFMSVPVTHILYTKFTNLHEQNIDLPSVLNADKDGPIDYPDNYVVQKSPFVCLGNNMSAALKMVLWYILCILIGLFPTVIIPAMLPVCSQQPGAGGAPTDHMLVGTSTAILFDGMDESFEDYILSKNLIENARNYDGNIFYYFNKHMTNPNQYFFVEGWESIEAVQKWMSTDHVHAAFNNYTYQMLEDGKLDLNAYFPLSRSQAQDDDKAPGAIKYTFKGFNGCTDIGDDMINFMNCEWILGCKGVKVIDENKGERQLILANGHVLNNKVTSANKQVDGDKINYTLTHYIQELDRSYYIELVADTVSECRGLFKFNSNIKIETIDATYRGFMDDNIPYLQNKYAVSTEIPINRASERILQCKTASEFVQAIMEVQADPDIYKEYTAIAPFLYTDDGQMIFNGQEFNGIDAIKQLYASLGSGTSSSVQHSFLMDPIIENYQDEDTVLITITSNVKQESLFSDGAGCDYTYPMYIQLEITKSYPIKIKKLLYNTPKYTTTEQSNVLTKCEYLSVKQRKKLSTNKDFIKVIYSYWDGFKIMNKENEADFAKLFGPFLDPSLNTIYEFNNTVYTDPMVFHQQFVQTILSGYRFYVTQIIGNDGFVTLGLRGNIISPDLKENYNDNFRLVIDYNLNENDKIISVKTHIDTVQLDNIMNEFYGTSDNSVCKASGGKSAQPNCQI